MTGILGLPNELLVRILKYLLNPDPLRGIIICADKSRLLSERSKVPHHYHEHQQSLDFWSNCDLAHSTSIRNMSYLRSLLDPGEVDTNVMAACRQLGEVGREILWGKNKIYLIECFHVYRRGWTNLPVCSNLDALLTVLGPRSASYIKRVNLVLILQDTKIPSAKDLVTNAETWIKEFARCSGIRRVKRSSVASKKRDISAISPYTDDKVVAKMDVNICTVVMSQNDANAETFASPGPFKKYPLQITWDIV